MEKTCKKCGEKYPNTIEYFQPKSIYCKLCAKAYQKEWYTNNKERHNKTAKQWYENNKENIKEARKNYRESHKDQAKKLSKNHYEKNKEQTKKNQKHYHETHKKQRKETRKQYYVKNKNNILEHQKQYYVNNKEVYDQYRKNNSERLKPFNIARQHRRRARIKQLPNNYSNVEWRECQDHFNNTCCYCGKKKRLTQDHFVATTNNGEYTANNIVPACGNCNSSKHDNDFFEWYPKQSFYSKQREQKMLKYLNYNPKTKIQQLALIK